MLNLLAIVANGGFMPVSPDTLARLHPGTSPDQWETGHHSYSKGITLARPETLLWQLSDTFVIPPPFPFPAAFSLGDVFIAGGVFLLLQTALAGSHPRQEAAEAQLGPVV
jgi:hypothetical protein